VFEEPFSAANPKNPCTNTDVKTVTELKKGIRPGEPAIREVAAYVLDHLGFAGVPMTITVNINGKTGSLQEYKKHDFESWDLGPSKYDAQQIHKIGLLDLRIFNIDRHGGNILVKTLPNGKNLLIPIDHGFSLSDTLDATDVWFEWYNWPQAKISFDRTTKTYVSKIDVMKDAESLRRLGIRKECIRTMIISSLVLKKGVSGGLNLHQIANLFMKNIIGKKQKVYPSYVEKLAETIPSLDDEQFWNQIGVIIESEMEKKIHSLRAMSRSHRQLQIPSREDQVWRRDSLRASA